MDTLTASAVIERQDCYAVPPNYIGPLLGCQRTDDGRVRDIEVGRGLFLFLSRLSLRI
jgi:hypothetical protein